jgi:hypothetical protein
MKLFAFSVFVTACFAPWSGAAIMLHQVEDFSAAHDWSGGNPNPNPPVVVADSGPTGSGDFSLRVTSNGGSGPGGKLLIFNTASWAGNYTAAGVTGLSVDIRNTGSNSLSFRLAFNGPGGWFVTSAAPVAAFTGWVHLEFDLHPSSLVRVEGSDAASTMAAVTEVRILHTTAVNFRGAQLASSFMVDEIAAIPEPSVWLITAAAGIGTFLRKR